jgi:hypothetical protein
MDHQVRPPLYVLFIEPVLGLLNTFRDHGRVHPTLEPGEQDAERALARLAKLRIDLGASTEKMVADGYHRFQLFFGRAAGLAERETQSDA